MNWLRNITGGKTLLRGLDHVAIVVSDMDRSIEFYTSILGMKLIKDGRAEGGLKKSFIGTDKKAILALTEEKDGPGSKGGRAAQGKGNRVYRGKSRPGRQDQGLSFPRPGRPRARNMRGNGKGSASILNGIKANIRLITYCVNFIDLS